jgi:hypothetical protein
MTVISVLQTALRLLFKFSYKDTQEIEIIDNFNSNHINEKMPLTTEDVEWYIEQVRKKAPNSLKGIKKIILCNKEPQLHINVLGSYSPEKGGAVIRLYGIAYLPIIDKYILDFNDLGKLKLGFTPAQARDLMLSTLGHEIGHNVEYRRSGRLFGDDVEKFCDQYADELNIVVDPERSGQGKLFHIDDIVPSQF